ncbi:hypothetical protein G6F35_016642 [Rhizopus arrhizus]|nr:hypothetical protein G6F35_016642 [Rhizopus arrhizus]
MRQPGSRPSRARFAQDPCRHRHALGNAGGGFRAHLRDGFGADFRRDRLHQCREIHRQAFGQGRGGRARVQLCQSGGADVLDAAARGFGGRRCGPGHCGSLRKAARPVSVPTQTRASRSLNRALSEAAKPPNREPIQSVCSLNSVAATDLPLAVNVTMTLRRSSWPGTRSTNPSRSSPSSRPVMVARVTPAPSAS